MLYLQINYMNSEPCKVEGQLRVWEERNLGGHGVQMGGIRRNQLCSNWARRRKSTLVSVVGVCVLKKAWVSSCDSKRSETESGLWGGGVVLGGWGWRRLPVGQEWLC